MYQKANKTWAKQNDTSKCREIIKQIKNTYASDQYQEYIKRQSENFSLELLESSPSNKSLVCERTGFARINLHIGQLKLALNELSFLTMFFDRADTVLYVGSGPGTHLPIIIRRFHDLAKGRRPLRWILYDPIESHCGSLIDLAWSPAYAGEIEIHQGPKYGYFTTERAKSFAQDESHGKILFISDIRGQMNGQDDVQIATDMKLQAEWCKIIAATGRLVAANLKFRPGWWNCELNTDWYNSKKLVYLSGTPIGQGFSPTHSTETRLLVTFNGDYELPERVYDVEDYNSKMFTFNLVTRQGHYSCSSDFAKEIPGIDNCYDCKFMETVVKAHINKFGGDPIAFTKELLYEVLQVSLVDKPHGWLPDERDRFKRLITLLNLYNPAFKKIFSR